MSSDALSPRQRQTVKGRAAFLDQFPDEASKRAHFQDLARQSKESRITLNAEEASALSEAYALLRKIAARHSKLAPSPEPTDPKAA